MRKPLGHKGFQRERATGVEPATSSLGSLKSAFRQLGGNQRKRRDYSALASFYVFPDCPETARLSTKNREPFPVEPEASEGVPTHCLDMPDQAYVAGTHAVLGEAK